MLGMEIGVALRAVCLGQPRGGKNLLVCFGVTPQNSQLGLNFWICTQESLFVVFR